MNNSIKTDDVIFNFFCADQMALDYEKSIKEAEKQIENIT